MGADWNYPLLVLQQALEPTTPHVQESMHYDFTTYMDTTYSDARQSEQTLLQEYIHHMTADSYCTTDKTKESSNGTRVSSIL